MIGISKSAFAEEELVCFGSREPWLSVGGRDDKRTRPSNVDFGSIRVPRACQSYQFPMERFMSSRVAKGIILKLNRQRKRGTRTFLPTINGVAAILTNLGMGSRDTPVQKRLQLKFIDRPFPPVNSSRSGEMINTASTNGIFLKIYTGIITSEAFEHQPGHFGSRRPRWVSHYAAVVVHEVGHVVHKRFQKRGKRYVNRIMKSHRYPDCFLDSRQFDSREEWAEWFADVFALSLINLANKAFL